MVSRDYNYPLEPDCLNTHTHCPLVVLSRQLVVALPLAVLSLRHPLVNLSRELIVSSPLLVLSLHPAPPVPYPSKVRYMAKEHVPRRGPNQQWVYLSSEAVLEECGMHTIGHYIDVRWETIAKYVVGRSILAECQGTDRRRGSVPRRWWWEQRMCLDDV